MNDPIIFEEKWNSKNDKRQNEKYEAQDHKEHANPFP